MRNIPSENRFYFDRLIGRARAADKVFGIDEGKMNPYRPHSLRSAFRSRLTGKTDGDLIKFWMGDVLGAKTGAYLNLPDEEHRQLYSAVEHRLSIEKTSADEIKEKSVTQDVYLKRLTQVEQENDSLRRLVENLAERLGRTEAFVEILGYDPDLETGEVKYDPEKDQRRS